MSVRTVLGDVAATSPQQVALRSGVVAGALVTLLATAGASGAWPGIAPLALIVAVGAAVRPDSGLPLGTIVLLGIGWVGDVNDPASLWSVSAALGLLLVHVAAAAATVAPVAATLPPRSLRRWGRRTALVAAAAPAAWVLVRLTTAVDISGSTVALVAAAVSVALGMWWLARRSA
jgi:hypothetical protein